MTVAGGAELRRDPARMASTEYDVLIVGGGIYGASAAWDAAQRGLRVALIERGDFGHATTANCLKLVHGGFRYLQHGDLVRIRESSHERAVLMRIAPHAVQPIPFVIPTYGHGMRGKEMLLTALCVYNGVAFDRNRGIRDPGRRIPFGHSLSRAECLEMFPGLPATRLTGAVVFYDGQMYDPTRVLLCYLTSAVGAGADAANYVEATGLLRHNGRVRGVRARDVLSGGDFEITAKMVLNASGPWVSEFLAKNGGPQLRPPVLFSKDWYLIARRQLTPNHALAVPSRYRDPNAVMSRGSRHLFLIPWRGHTLIGSSHVNHEGSAEAWEVTEADLVSLLDEINEAYPEGKLERRDISFFNAGLVPREASAGADVRLGRRHRLIDHEVVHGVAGLISLVGVRYTTARRVAKRAVDLLVRRLGRPRIPSRTDTTPLDGGDMESFSSYLSEQQGRHASRHSGAVVEHLVRTHGTHAGAVFGLAAADTCLGERLGDSPVIGAQVAYAVRREMAMTLGDVVFRRTQLGTAGHPGTEALEACARLTARELGWSDQQRDAEVARVTAAFP